MGSSNLTYEASCVPKHFVSWAIEGLVRGNLGYHRDISVSLLAPRACAKCIDIKRKHQAELDVGREYRGIFIIGGNRLSWIVRLNLLEILSRRSS
jgi:hypothetical protein